MQLGKGGNYCFRFYYYSSFREVLIAFNAPAPAPVYVSVPDPVSTPAPVTIPDP